jgi:hypothetical protein
VAFPLDQLRKLVLRALPKASNSDQTVIAIVMQGLRATIEDGRFDVLVLRLNKVDSDMRGFAYEGAGVGLTVFDYLVPWRRRLQAFVRGPGAPYMIPVYIGAGLALGRFKSRRPEKFLTRLDNPTFRWMVMDGYGFHQGFFTRQRYIEKQAVPTYLSSYALHVFDQGLGRSIWFVANENVERVAATITAFPENRRSDLWSGAGFACAYAGSAMERKDLEMLRTMAGPYRSQLELAGTLAAKRRNGFGHITPHTELACQVFCGLSGELAAGIANDALENLPINASDSPHKIWRERIMAEFGSRTENAYQVKGTKQ